MKKPDEIIKKGLECGFCDECSYDNNKLETVEEWKWSQIQSVSTLA